MTSQRPGGLGDAKNEDDFSCPYLESVAFNRKFAHCASNFTMTPVEWAKRGHSPAPGPFFAQLRKHGFPAC